MRSSLPSSIPCDGKGKALTSPASNRWSNQFPNIYYVKVDVDAIPDLAQEYGVRAMPTFMLFKNGEKDADLMGAMPGPLQKLITDNHPAEAATSA